MNIRFHDSSTIGVTSGRNWPQSAARLAVALLIGFAPDRAFSGQFLEGNVGSSGWTRTSNPPVNSRTFDTFAVAAQQDTTASTKASTKSSSLVLPAVFFIGVQGLDAHSTWKVRSGRGGVEVNPVMNVGTAGQVVAKAAACVAVVFLADRLHRKHPKIAKAVLWAGAGVTAGAASNNYRIANGQR